MHKEINCAVCFNTYNIKEHQPRILTGCGHTICEDCLKKCVVISPVSPFNIGSSSRTLIFGNTRGDNGSGKTQVTIKCPLCKQSSSTMNNGTVETADIVDFFPLNYALMGVIEFIQREFGALDNCSLHNNMLNNFCMDSNCKERKLFCVDCFFSSHKNCKPDMIIDPISVQLRIKYAEYETEFDELSRKLSEMHQSIIQKFGIEVRKLTEEFISGLKKEYVCLNIKDLKSFEMNFSRLKMTQDTDSESKFIHLKPQNKELIDKNVKFEEIEKHMEAILLELPVANAKLKLNEILESISVIQ